MRRVLLILVVLMVVAAAWWALRPEAPLERAYIRGRSVNAWNRVAQVREPVATLRYGDVVEVLERQAENVRIRTAQGDEGWGGSAHRPAFLGRARRSRGASGSRVQAVLRGRGEAGRKSAPRRLGV